MAQRRGFHQARVQSRARRLTSWGFGPGSSATAALTAAGQQILGNGVVLTLEDVVTLVRLRGNLQVFLTSVAAAGEGFHGAVGVAIINTQAFAIGATAIPGPLSEMEWHGWLYHRLFDLHSTSATVGNSAAGAYFNLEVDSKAMRKWSANETLVAMVEVVEIGTSVGEIFFDSRVLVKLS